MSSYISQIIHTAQEPIFHVPNFHRATSQWMLMAGSRFILAVASLLTTPASLASESTTFASTCVGLDPLQHVSGVSINAHEFLPAGTLLSLPDYGCGKVSEMISTDLCRIALNITTSSRSSVIFEGWFPMAWSGRFLVTGNGGIDGCIKYDDMTYTTGLGFATVGSNNGHNGTGGTAFYHNQEILMDYVYRSLHTITDVGKKLTQAFYVSSLKKSYYFGCSGGGRQGIHAAEAYPEDFDGILIGDPAVNFNNMSSWRASFFSKTGSANSTNFIPATAWKTFIHREVLQQCDAIDGVKDGIIEDPELCHFQAEKLLCLAGENQTGSCLTAAQVRIVNSVLSPLYGSQGEVVFPAMQPGSEISAADGLYSGKPWSYSLDWFRYVVYDDPTWDSAGFSVTDITAAHKLNPFNVETFPSNLSLFTAAPHHGKLLLYHGQQDHQITSYTSAQLYAHLAQHTPDLDKSIRYFRISGMGHCGGGPGAWMIGQSAAASTSTSTSIGTGTDTDADADSNILAALVRWVENGTAPETITGRKFFDDDPSKGLWFQRRHCRYPFRNTYVGGNAHSLESWECVRKE